jgi:general secretion pathway protein C
MQAISPERSSFAQTAAVSLVTFAALALLGLVLAYWTWAWLGPRPEPRAQAVQAAGRAAGPSQAASDLFGGAQRDSGTAPAGFPLRLLGVVAADGGRSVTSSGYAVFRLDAKQSVAVREGGEIEPGVRLAEVHADHVVLERGGVQEKLAWPEKSKPAAAVAPRAKN